MDAGYLYAKFLNQKNNKHSLFYIPHLDKPSVAQNFKTHRTCLAHQIQYVDSRNLASLDAELMALAKVSSSIILYTGVTSTLSLLLEFARVEKLLHKFTIHIAPDFNSTIQEKALQSRGFYAHVKANYGPIIVEHSISA